MVPFPFPMAMIFFICLLKLCILLLGKTPSLSCLMEIKSICEVRGWESSKRSFPNLLHHQKSWNVMKTSAALGGLPNCRGRWHTGQLSGWTLSFFKAFHFCWFGYSYNQTIAKRKINLSHSFFQVISKSANTRSTKCQF